MNNSAARSDLITAQTIILELKPKQQQHKYNL